MSESGLYEPKCGDLIEAIMEVRFWIGVNMARFQYSEASLTALMRACLAFLGEVDA